MNPKAACLWALLALALAGCAAPKGKFQTQSDPAYGGKLEQVLIVYFNVDTAYTLGRDFSDRLVTRVSALLTQRKVPAEAVRLEREVLDRDAPVRAAAARFRPKQFLYFAITRVNMSRGVNRPSPGDVPHFTSEMSANFEFSLIEARNGRTVWRADAQYYSPPSAEDVAAQLVEQLVAAQLF